MNLAIIPARSGSKRIKNKNTKLFFKKPVISYSILAAINSKLFNHVIVSTDSKKIAKISKKMGASVYFLRPKNISNDNSTTQEVIDHSISWFKKKNIKFKYVCCIYPVAPLLTSYYLKKSFKKIRKENWDFVFSAVEYSTPIQKALYLKNKKVFFEYPNFFKIKSNKLKKNFYDAGQFYWGTPKAWNKKDIIYGCKSTIYQIPKHLAEDVNTKEDWDYLKKLYKILRTKK